MREGEPKDFLEEKYPDLHQSEEVKSAVTRQEVRTGEEVKQQPKEKIEAYLDRLNEVFNPDNPDKRERRVDILKDKLHEFFVVKVEDIPESYFNNQRRIAREQGHGDVEITDEMRKQMADIIIHDQTKSLDAWVDYLGSQDAVYPNWLKYFAFRSITKLSEYDKDKKEFKKRSKGTTATFPDINREALAYVLDAVEKSHKKESKEGTTDEQWEKLLKTANFGKLYGYAIEKITPATQEDKENIRGEWVKYDQGGDAEPLYKSLQGHGTGWCTAGEGVARTQLEAGDFYVYYSKNKKEENSPRVAIRMQQGEIAEVRGIDADQNLEGVMTGVAKEKMKELPGAEKYEKRVSDMKQLTDIEKKMQSRQELTREELRFIYEVEGEIDGFGYQKDPRIQELKEKRDQQKDLPIIFECQPGQIAFGKEQIVPGTIAYIGEWTPEVLNLLPENVKYVYENFPKERIFWRTIETDPGIRNAGDAKIILKGEGFEISNFAGEILEKTAFSKEKQRYEVVSFSAKSLGFSEGAKYADIIARAKKFGLDLCPAEVGPQLRLQYKDQPMRERLFIGMEPVADSGGSLKLFNVEHGVSDQWLDSYCDDPGYVWGGHNRFVFVRSRK